MTVLLLERSTHKLRAFRSVQEEVKRLQDEDDNCNLLHDVQHEILAGIYGCELAIQRLRARREVTLSSCKTTSSRNRAIIDRLKWERWIWRSFGDAIAHIYLDRFTIKQLHYNVENYRVKQDGGFMIDKSGLDNEISIFNSIIGQGVPCVLTDITNVIRYGDICVVKFGFPHIIEVKSSGVKDSRSKKQIRRIRRIASFLRDDFAEDMRGTQLYRVDATSDVVDHCGALNRCMRDARGQGVAVVNPEKGLYYLCAQEAGSEGASNVIEALKKLKVERACFFALASYKRSMNWEPYRPIQLAIESHDDYCNLIHRRVSIFVLYDLGVAEEQINAAGFEVEFGDLDDDIFLTSVHEAEDVKVRTSSAFFARIGFEFVSPAWIIQQHIMMRPPVPSSAPF